MSIPENTEKTTQDAVIIILMSSLWEKICNEKPTEDSHEQPQWNSKIYMPSLSKRICKEKQIWQSHEKPQWNFLRGNFFNLQHKSIVL